MEKITLNKRDSKTLRKLYVEDQCSIAEIAEAWGMAKSTIRRLLEEDLGVTIRTRGRIAGKAYA